MALNIHASQVVNGERFEFGENWSKFLKNLSEERILAAEESLKNMLRVDSLDNRTFLDIGSGSGLFSLAAKRLGARVVSFDFDPASVACTRSLKSTYFCDDDTWSIYEGSVLDSEFMMNLGQFDIVYSWGVLHHTGNMNQALRNATYCVDNKGVIFIAIYNDQGWISSYWIFIKKLYNSSRVGKLLAMAIPMPYFLTYRFFRLLFPKQKKRGMDWWRDIVDWVGGYPFEVASPESMIDLFYEQGFSLIKQKTVKNKHGCNEFVFIKL